MKLQELLNALVVKDTATGRYGLRTVAKATNLSNNPVDLDSDLTQVMQGLVGNDADNKPAVCYKRITSATNTDIGNNMLSIEEAIRKCLAYDVNGQLCLVLIENV